MPYTCYKNKDKFIKLIEILDGINLSVQHFNEKKADKIRGTKSKYNRQQFYESLPYKEKIRINLNICKPYLYEKKHIVKCIEHYDKMGFNSIKLSEIQHGVEYYTSFEKIFNIKYGSPFFSGCQRYLDVSNIDELNRIKTPILLKRSCFACEDTLNASFMDGVKVLYKMITKNKSPNNYVVINENGKIQQGWK